MMDILLIAGAIFFFILCFGLIKLFDVLQGSES